MWASQHYIQIGKSLGVDDDVLENAVDQIDCVLDVNKDLPSILTLNHLATRAKVGHAFLRRVISRTQNGAYRHFAVKKRTGGQRWISVPHPQLLIVQRWLAKHVLNRIDASRHSYAFELESSIKKCAEQHIHAKWMVKMDVEDFFWSISEIDVYRVFVSLGYQPLVAFELSRLTTWPLVSHAPAGAAVWRAHPRDGIPTYSWDSMGCLPQGAPTSPMLSNLVMRALDDEIYRVARKHKMVFTRYADDLTFSSQDDALGRTVCRELIGEVGGLLRQRGFNPKRKKTVVVPPGARKVVLGLNVDGDVPRLPKEFKSKMRQHLYYLRTVGPAAHAAKRNFDTVWGLQRHLRGLVDFAHMVEPEYGSELLRALGAVSWPV